MAEKGAPKRDRLPAALEDEQMKEREFCITVIFSIYSRSGMVDGNGGAIFPKHVYGSHIAHTIAWEEGSFNYDKIKADERKPENSRTIRKDIYIDCKDLNIDPYTITNPTSDGMMKKLKRAVEVIKGFLDINTAKGYKGTVHFNICGYCPVEALVFGLEMLLMRHTPSQALYQDFIKDIPENMLDTFNPYTKEFFSFNIDYQCVYTGYSYYCPKPRDPYERLSKIKNKIDKLREQQQINGNGTFYRASADWEYLDRIEKEKGHIPGVDYPRRDQVEYEGRFLTMDELQKEHDRIEMVFLVRKQAQDEYDMLSVSQKEEMKVNQAREVYMHSYGQSHARVEELSRLEKQLDLQQNDSDSAEAWAYDQGYWLHEDEGALKDYHTIDQIEFEAEYLTISELKKIKKELEIEIDKAQKEIRALEESSIDAIKKAELEEKRKTLKVIQFAIGIGSLIIGPLALIDLVIEVYQMIEDGDPSHLWAIGADLIGVIPVVGGVASKFAKGASAASGVTSKAFKGASSVVYDGVKAGEKIDSALVTSVELKDAAILQSALKDAKVASTRPQAIETMTKVVDKYESYAKELTSMNGQLNSFRDAVMNKPNQLGKIIYDKNVSKVSIKAFVQNSSLFISNFDKLTKVSKLKGSTMLLADTYSTGYTAIGIVQNGYAISRY